MCMRSREGVYKPNKPYRSWYGLFEPKTIEGFTPIELYPTLDKSSYWTKQGLSLFDPLSNRVAQSRLNYTYSTP